MKKTGSIFQYRDKWYGVGFEVSGKSIRNIETYEEKSLEELKGLFKGRRHGISVSPSEGYVVRLQFPFSGKRKIGLVIGSELEDCLPFPIENVSFDFKETGVGGVLAVAMPEGTIEGLRKNGNPASITMNSMAALQLLRWLDKIRQDTFAFVYGEAGTAVVLSFKDGALQGARQFHYLPDMLAIADALLDMGKDDQRMADAPCYLVLDDGDAILKAELSAREKRARIEIPSLKEHDDLKGLPGIFLVGIGSALLALNPGADINLLARARDVSSGRGAVIYITGGLALLGLVVSGLSYLNLTLKERALRQLSRQQTTIYQSAFPKAPPVKDVEQAFKNRLRSMNHDPAVVETSTSPTPLTVLARISAAIDTETDVKLNEFAWEEKQFSVSGTTTSFSAVERMKSAMEKIEGVRSMEVENVDLSSARQVKFKLRGLF